MPKYKRYTRKLVERQIRAIIRRNPDNVNPHDETSCLYRTGRGPNIRRCLVGQWGYEQGFKTPRPDNGDVGEVVDEMWSAQADFDPDAVDYLVELQSAADDSKNKSWRDEPSPLAWKDIVIPTAA